MEKVQKSIAKEAKRLAGPGMAGGCKTLGKWARKGLRTDYQRFMYIDFLLFINSEQKELSRIKRTK